MEKKETILKYQLPIYNMDTTQEKETKEKVEELLKYYREVLREEELDNKIAEELIIWEIKYASSLGQLEYIHRIIATFYSNKAISTKLLVEIDKYRKAKGEILKLRQ